MIPKEVNIIKHKIISQNASCSRRLCAVRTNWQSQRIILLLVRAPSLCSPVGAPRSHRNSELVESLRSTKCRLWRTLCLKIRFTII
jgi:hypothetical protein